MKDPKTVPDLHLIQEIWNFGKKLLFIITINIIDITINILQILEFLNHSIIIIIIIISIFTVIININKYISLLLLFLSSI